MLYVLLEKKEIGLAFWLQCYTCLLENLENKDMIELVTQKVLTCK